MPESRALPLVAVATTLVLWASAFVGIRRLATVLSPGALSLGRLAVGSLALGIGVVATGWVRPTRAEWTRLVVIGLLWFGVYNLALNAGERAVDAGTAALLIQLSPIMIAVLSVLLLGERLHVTLVAGIALAFVGVALIAWASSGGRGNSVGGVLLCLVSAVTYSVSVVVQKPLMARLPAIQVTWVACTVGALACLPFVGGLASPAGHATAGAWAWLVYLGLFPTAIAFTTYAFALKHMSASSLAVTTYLVPPITIGLSWVLLSETPRWVAYVGGALALAGVGLARRRPRARAADQEPAPS